MGTLGYAPPEQISGDVDAIGPASDVYGLGAILYQMLCGETTIKTKGRKLQQIANDTLQGKIEQPNPKVHNAPKALVAVCMKSLALRPDDRYTSAHEFIRELERWKADQPVKARQESFVERATRFARKHRAATTASAIALTSIAIVSSTALVEVNRQRHFATDAANAERTQKIEAQEQRKKAEALAASERHAKEEATRLAARNSEVVEAFVAAFRSPDVENDRVDSQMTALEVLQHALVRLDDDGNLKTDPLSRADLLEALGISFNSLGATEESTNCHKKSYELRERVLGVEDVKTLESLNNLGAAYYEAGRVEESLEINEQVLKIRIATLGEADEATLTTMNNLAAVKYQQGRLKEAADLFARTLAVQRQNLGVEHADTLSTMNNLAFAYKTMGLLDKAISLLEETLKLRERALGKVHPNTLGSMNNLALAYDAADRMDEALSLGYAEIDQIEDAITVSEKAAQLAKARFGPKHRTTQISIRVQVKHYEQAKLSSKADKLREELTVPE